MTNETWASVIGWSRYEVSDSGRVRSKGLRVLSRGTGHWRPGKILKPVTTHRGRVQVTLTDGPRRRSAQVSVLVAEAFLGPRPEGRHVAHKDDDVGNNVLRNLYYATPVENYADSVRNGADRWATRRRNAALTATPEGLMT